MDNYNTQKREISCRAINTLIRYAEHHKKDVRGLVEGIGYDKDYLTDTNNWVECRIFEEIAKDILDDARNVVKETLQKHTHKNSDWRFTRKMIEDALERFLYHATERRPMILPVVVEV